MKGLSMGHIILTLALALADSDARLPVVESRADVVEHHTLYTDEGCVTFDQMIWWEWQPEFSRYVVVAWRLWNPGRNVRWSEPRKGVLVFMDGADLRRVRYGARRRSHTQEFDPEMHDRATVADDARKGLGKP